MKKMRKLLALVIVLVFALSLIPMTASAIPADMNYDDYTDAAEIEYVEAVDVLTALGVLQGTDKAFRPKDSITRAEAAKIITYILIGTRAADALTPVATGFKDVPVTHWASPFIAYCAQKGIISGYGNGRFGPSDNVTALQMGKMLLGAVGYGANGEYEGEGWELRVIERATARTIGILAGTGNVDYSLPATREQVARYTFNALTVPLQVTWNSVINDYSSWSDIWNTSGTSRNTLGFDTFDLGSVRIPDAYGFGGRFWRIITTNKTLTGYHRTDVVLAKSTDGTPISRTSATSPSLTVLGARGYVAEFGPTVVGGDNVTAWTVPIYVNGVLIDSANHDDQAWALRLANVSGVIVNLMDRPPFDGRVDNIVIIANNPVEALGAPTINASNGNVSIPGTSARSFNFTPANGATNSPYNEIVAQPVGLEVGRTVGNTEAGLVEYVDGIKSGDMLLVHTKVVRNNTVIVVDKAETKTGQMTAAAPNATPAPTITFGGETLRQSGLTPGVLFTSLSPIFPGVTPFITVNSNFNKDATVWLDPNGDVIKATTGIAAPAIYGLVFAYRHNGMINGAAEVRLMTADGKIGVYNVAPDPATGRVENQTGTFGFPVGTNAYLVTYEFTEDEKAVTLTRVATLIPGDAMASFVGGPAAYTYTGRSSVVQLDGENYTLTGTTAVFYFDYTDEYDAVDNPGFGGKGASSATMTVTGTAAFAPASAVWYVLESGRNIAAIVFGQDNPAATLRKYAFIENGGFASQEFKDGRMVYYYEAFIDGAKKTLESTDATIFATPGLYTYQEGITSGLVIGSTVNPESINGLVTSKDAAMLVYNGGSSHIGSSTVFYQYTPPAGPNRGEAVRNDALATSNMQSTLYYIVGIELVPNSAEGTPAVAVYWSLVSATTTTATATSMNLNDAMDNAGGPNRATDITYAAYVNRVLFERPTASFDYAGPLTETIPITEGMLRLQVERAAGVWTTITDLSALIPGSDVGNQVRFELRYGTLASSTYLGLVPPTIVS